MPNTKKFIVLNFKTYPSTYGFSGLNLCRIAKEVSNSYGVRIIVCPNALLLAQATEIGADVFAQHVDSNKPGPFTGSISAKMLAEINVKGSLINHSEKRLSPENVKGAVDELKENDLESMVCVQDVNEAIKYSSFRPTYIAVEPPELIGTGISVSKAKPELITSSISAIKHVDEHIKIVCGAGISNAEDVKKAIELGVDGVLLSSAFVHAPNHRKFLESLIAVLD
ncbi:MAG: triose-phosphate isomerase [Candidatus Micrarchaeota archaeon]|nr:triose-phosphate isomerase [Candidatus Micrarchaeota archaeon]